MNTQIFSAIFDIVSTPMSGPSLTSVSQVKTFSSLACRLHTYLPLSEMATVLQTYYRVTLFLPFQHSQMIVRFKIIWKGMGWLKWQGINILRQLLFNARTLNVICKTTLRLRFRTERITNANCDGWWAL